MTARHFVYGTLAEHSELTSEIGGIDNPRIFAKKTMTSSIEQHPYLVYKLGNETPEMLNEELEVSRQFFQVWVHDYHDSEVADYDRIDRIIELIRQAFWIKGSKEDGIWITIWEETSQDLNDETLNTIFKYVRFRILRRAQ